ncbi:alpha-glucosidase mal12 [Lignoscripta atroalba]|nr:alpha-glucosidase mal12 [Lignoscripta atroalba]
MSVGERTWWKDGTVYQIWPASYKDSDGDGVGDIPGIISTLDYLKDLGVDIIWCSPMYDSPQVDMGYDISNYEDIYPPYGTIEDADRLIKETHDRGMRIVFDLVINHTSDQHAWFKESSSSKDNPKRDWYIWRPAKVDGDGKRKPPNNWRSHFGGSAWKWDEKTQEYFLHLFAPEQPDLNWESETTRKAIYDSSMKFWLDKGVDGFRIDTVNMYSKGIEFADAPIVDPKSDTQVAHSIFCNGPRMHEFLREMNDVCSKYDCMTVGELPHTPNAADVIRYVSAKERELNMVFQFNIVDLGQGSDYKYEYEPFTLSDLRSTIDEMQQLISGNDGWATAFMENHDQGRSISRFASDDPKYREHSGKMLAILLVTLTGTLYIYQGQEIGMINCPRDWPIEEYKDIESINYYHYVEEQTGGDEKALKKAFEGIQKVGRDHARTPVHWDDSAHAGFTTGKPWMRVHDIYPEVNIKKQLGEKDSLLSFWKKMLKLRKEHVDLFGHGNFELLKVGGEKSFMYTKEFEGKKVLVALNFTDDEQAFEKPGAVKGNLTLLVSNVEAPGEVLAPWEGRIYYVE